MHLVNLLATSSFFSDSMKLLSQKIKVELHNLMLNLFPDFYQCLPSTENDIVRETLTTAPPAPHKELKSMCFTLTALKCHITYIMLWCAITLHA